MSELPEKNISIKDRLVFHKTLDSILCINQIATRETYGNALVKLYKTCPRVIALDGDTKNSTHSLKLKKANNDNYIECFIAEQNLIGVAVGCGTRHRTIPFASTFACFLSRGYDQIRMAAISQANVKFCGSHVGVSIGKHIYVFIMLVSKLKSLFMLMILSILLNSSICSKLLFL